jgi:hypothetical protein
MKLFSKLITAATATFVSLAALTMIVGGTANADCLYQYNANGFTTSATPVFNSICGGVPEGINNETDFVRIRQNTNGDDTDNQNNSAYTVGSLTSACTTGTKYDIWNYLHNDASTNYNPDVNPTNPSAVAHDVQTALKAPIGTSGTSFTFGDTVTAKDMNGNPVTPVSDSVILNCNGQPVTLSLVPSTVNVYSDPYGNWEAVPNGDSYVTPTGNNPLTLGSTSAGLSSMGGGDMWGCWTYRIVVVYQVTVTAVPVVKTPPTCNLLTLENDSGVARIDVDYTANDANVTGVSLLIENGSSSITKPLTLSELPFSYKLSSGTTTFTATVKSDLGNVTSANCVGTLTTTPPPVTPPPTTPPKVIPPTQLVNTGPGSVAALFVGATVVGAGIYHWIVRRKLASK